MIQHIFTVGHVVTSMSKQHGAIFLSGPIERRQSNQPPQLPCWRADAFELLRRATPTVVVYTPEWGKKPEGWSYENQVAWEVMAMEWADVILFWIPRQLPELPGFTTNIEFGEWLHSGKIMVGAPPDAPHMQYLRTRCHGANIPWYNTLEDCCTAAVRKLGEANHV